MKSKNIAEDGSSAMHHPKVVVNRSQEGNPLLNHLDYVWGDVTADYQAGHQSILFLSLRFYQKQRSYIHARLADCRREGFERIVVLLMKDLDDDVLTSQVMVAVTTTYNASVILTFNWKEAAQYIWELKKNEKKPDVNSVAPKTETDHKARVVQILTSVRSINSTDAETLMKEFGCFRDICNADLETLIGIRGFGPKKAEDLYRALNEPIKWSKA